MLHTFFHISNLKYTTYYLFNFNDKVQKCVYILFSITNAIQILQFKLTFTGIWHLCYFAFFAQHISYIMWVIFQIKIDLFVKSKTQQNWNPEEIK